MQHFNLQPKLVSHLVACCVYITPAGPQTARSQSTPDNLYLFSYAPLFTIISMLDLYWEPLERKRRKKKRKEREREREETDSVNFSCVRRLSLAYCSTVSLVFDIKRKREIEI